MFRTPLDISIPVLITIILNYTPMIQFRQFVIVSKVGNITEIMFSVNIRNSDINLKTGSVPKYDTMYVIETC